MTNHQIQDIPQLVSYFGEDAPTPTIAWQFTPGKGWRRYAFRKRVSRSWLRKMRNDGVTVVHLTIPDPRYGDGLRGADFSIEELLKEDRRPLFPGNVIGAAVKL